MFESKSTEIMDELVFGYNITLNVLTFMRDFVSYLQYFVLSFRPVTFTNFWLQRESSKYFYNGPVFEIKKI